MSNKIAAYVMATGLLPLAAQVSPGVVANVGDAQISTDQLEQRIGSRSLKFRSQEYAMRRAMLDSLIDNEILSQEAVANNVSVEELLRSRVIAKVAPISTEQARIGYEATHPSEKSPPSEAALRRVTESMRSQRITAARARYIADLRKRYDVSVFLNPPRASFPEDKGPSQGPQAAPVTIVAFSDFQCPFCANAEKTIAEIREKYRD